MNYPQRVREAFIYSAKHLGYWDDDMSKAVRAGKTDMLYLDPNSLEKAILDLITEAQIEVLEEIDYLNNGSSLESQHMAVQSLVDGRLAKLKPKTGDQ